MKADLPPYAFQDLNRCNLPSKLLGSLSYQQHPVPLSIDGVHSLHAGLFQQLEQLESAKERAELFRIHMRASFLLDYPDEAGFVESGPLPGKVKTDYLRLLRGWSFDADGQEAAVIKGWVQSRFGLAPLSHKGLIGSQAGQANAVYESDRAKGLYNTNSLEAQLDLLYSYCQYEIAKAMPGQSHIRLYRGVNRISAHETLQHPNARRYVLLLNNINSFSGDEERADEFGDYVFYADVPLTKLVYRPNLLPPLLQGEAEYLVIGGVYAMHLLRP